MSAPFFRAPFTINNGDAASAIYLTNMCQVSAYATGASVLIGNPSASTAQALSEISISNGLSLSASGVLSVSSVISVSGSVSDATGNVRTLPVNAQSVNYVLAASDAGGIVNLTGGSSVTINAAVFTTGQACTIINTTGATATITQGTATVVQAGTGTTGSRSLANYGIATVVNYSGSNFLISGTGVF